MTEQSQSRWVKYALATPITVTWEKPTETITKLMHWPVDKKVLIVRDPQSERSTAHHYIDPQSPSLTLGHDAYMETLKTIAKKRNMTPREVLTKLKEGATFSLDYATPLTYRDNKRGTIHAWKEIPAKMDKKKKKKKKKKL